MVHFGCQFPFLDRQAHDAKIEAGVLAQQYRCYRCYRGEVSFAGARLYEGRS